MAERASYQIQTLRNGLAVLDYVAHANHPVGPSELAGHLGIHKNNAFRILVTLEADGWLEHSEDGERYYPGPRIVEACSAAVHGKVLLLREAAERVLKDTEGAL